MGVQMTAPPTIEPHPENPALAGGHPPYYQAPGYQPIPPNPPRESWMRRNPGVVLSILAGGWLAIQVVLSLFLDSERAARQLAIDNGDRAEAKSRERSDALIRKEIRANGADIRTLAGHHLESSRHTRALLRQIIGDSSPRLDLPPGLREAEGELRALQRRN